MLAVSARYNGWILKQGRKVGGLILFLYKVKLIRLQEGDVTISGCTLGCKYSHVLTHLIICIEGEEEGP